MKDANKEEAPAEPPAPPKSKLIPILVGVNSLILIGVLGFVGYSATRKPAPAADEHADEAGDVPEEAPPEKPEPKKESGKKEGENPKSTAGGPGPLVKVPDFVVHLRNADVDRYARVTFEVEVIGEADKDRLTAHMPRIRDAVIIYLSDRSVEELRGSEGLVRMKEALYQRLRELVPEARLRALYISDFVVQ